MITYYKKQDGKIIKSTPFLKVAESWGEYETTEENIVYGYDGSLYLESECPEPPAPTKDYIKQMRIDYRHTHIDDQTLERNRKMANGTWTQEDEAEYLALDEEVTAYIEENLPYPTDPITE